MNLLPHKSWHVYNKDNIAKVKKDEAEAKARDEIARTRAIKAEQEYRLQQLRERLPSSDNAKDGSHRRQNQIADISSMQDAKGHINLFADLEKAQLRIGNPDVAKEKKAADEKWDRRYTMYLDQSKREKQPWYTARDTPSKTTEGQSSKRKKAHYEDPLLLVNKALASGSIVTTLDKAKMYNENHNIRQTQGVAERLRAQDDDDQDVRDERLKKHKQARQERKHSESNQSEEGDNVSLSKKLKGKEDKKKERESTSQPNMEQLRAEMLKRQEDERVRISYLRTGVTINESESEEGGTLVTHGKYWSQFNPSYVRNNRREDDSKDCKLDSQSRYKRRYNSQSSHCP